MVLADKVKEGSAAFADRGGAQIGVLTMLRELGARLLKLIWPAFRKLRFCHEPQVPLALG
jgi:hypothetical protein